MLVLLMTAVTGAVAQTISLDFEDGNMPQGWTHYGATDGWYVDGDDYYGHTPAFSGTTYSLYIDGHGEYDHDYFVSPAINFQGEGSLSFAYSTTPWSGDFNNLTVAYSTSPDGPWTWTSFVEQTSDGWTTATVDLSSLNGTYYIAFISYDNYGYSTAIDNINFVNCSVAPAGYTVSMPQNTADKDNWTAKAGTDGTYQQLPLEGVAEGTQVSLKYEGKKKVKSITIEKAAE